MIINRTTRSDKQVDADLKKCHKEYAKAIFEIFYKLNQELKEARTGEIFDFKTVYGSNFEKLTEYMQIQLVNSINIGAVVYTLTPEVKNPKEIIVEIDEPSKDLDYEPPIWRNGEVVDNGLHLGIPRDVFLKMTLQERTEHVKKWDLMIDEEKIKFIQNYKSPNHLQ